MRITASWARKLPIVLALAAAPLARATAQAPADVDGLLDRVAARIEQYYRRAQNIVCLEKMIAQPISSMGWAPEGFPRTVESELRVEWETPADGELPSDANVVRDIRKVNGRAPKSKDKPGCYDPNPMSPEPLTFLLPTHRDEYTFTWAGFGKGRESNIAFVDVREKEVGKPAFEPDSKGREECFGISLPGATRKRVWIDVDTHDVVRVEEHLLSRVDVRVPAKEQTRSRLPDVIVIDRYDSSIKYKAVKFDNPEELLLLPESIDVLAVLHGGQSYRKQQMFSNYRRFLTGGRIIK